VPLPTQPLAGIKHTFIVLVLPTNSEFKHLKNAVHNIHRLTWALAHVLKTALDLWPDELKTGTIL
jgi:hypothetical protein